MNDKYLNEAIKEGYIGIEKHDGGPFGAVVVKDGEIISKAHNCVISLKDPTAHAEMEAIRKACQVLNTNDLSECIIYSSCEPCPMCISAIIWSNIKKVYYGASRMDANKIGFRDNIIYDYLSSKNNIIEKIEVVDTNAINLLNDYKGDIY